MVTIVCDARHSVRCARSLWWFNTWFVQRPLAAARSRLCQTGDSVMNTDDAASQARLRYGFWVVIAGLVVVVGIFLAANAKWTTANDVTAVVGSITGVVGTLVGAFFGVQVGAAGKEKAESDRRRAEETAQQALAHLDPSVADSIRTR